MAKKNLYDLLGVPANADFIQIRRAYMLRSKMLHPDRFDQTTQRAEWDLANEMLKELNHAYGILRDAGRRAEYDKTPNGVTAPPSAPPPPAPVTNTRGVLPQVRLKWWTKVFACGGLLAAGVLFIRYHNAGDEFPVGWVIGACIPAIVLLVCILKRCRNCQAWWTVGVIQRQLLQTYMTTKRVPRKV